jgi:hypothetical protein
MNRTFAVRCDQRAKSWSVSNEFGVSVSSTQWSLLQLSDNKINFCPLTTIALSLIYNSTTLHTHATALETSATACAM